jgi:YD repeat-containing protein
MFRMNFIQSYQPSVIRIRCKRIEQATTDTSGSQGFAATPAGAARTWTYTYNSIGQVLSAKGPRTDMDDSATYTYDSATGNLLTNRNASGHLNTFSNYDLYGRPGRIADLNGSVTDLSYTPRGWLKDRTVTAGGVTRTTHYGYDNLGQLKTVALPDGTSITYTYDDAHRLTDIADSLGNRIHYILDAIGNRTQEETRDPTGSLKRQLSRLYDVLNRLQQATGGAQ